jgi:hypothetical protein
MPASQEIVKSVISMVHDIQMMMPQPVAAPVLPSQRWTLPPPECLKINLDGAFKQETKVGAWGFVVRDHEGSAVLAGAGNLGPVHNALLAETMACKQALEAAEHFGISQVIVETDSSQLKEAITLTASDLSVGGGLFTEIRSCLQDSFNCLNICKIPRSCNSCAHDLASLSMS